MIILLLGRFDDGFDYYRPFYKRFTCRSFSKILAFSARGLTQRWPLAPSWKITFEPEHLESCMKKLFRVSRPREYRFWHQFDFDGMTSFWQHGRHLVERKLTCWTGAPRILNQYFISAKSIALVQIMKVTSRTKVKVMWQGQVHSKVTFEFIYNGYGIEVLDLTSIKGARIPLPDMMTSGSSRNELAMGWELYWLDFLWWYKPRA